MSVLGTGVGDPSQLPFHWLRESREPAYTAGPSRLHPVLTMTVLPGLQRLDGAATPLPLSRSVRSWACVTANVPPRHGNINPFPFRRRPVRSRLRTGLPSAEDALPRNPGPFGGRDSHPSCAVTTAGIFNPSGSTRPHGLASSPPGRPPTGSPSIRGCPEVSAAGLVPEIFGASRLGG